MKKVKVNIYFTIGSIILLFLILITNIKLGYIDILLIKLELFKIFVFGLLCFFIPDFIVKIKRRLHYAQSMNELRFLKKMFVLNGSIKPVDFRKVMKSIIARSVCFKKDLELIEDSHKKSNIDSETFYSNLINCSKNVSVRLFYEKLDQAANYDFDQAVRNIAGDAITEKREYVRFIKKKTELIHIIGVVGILIIITIAMVYFLAPWLNMVSLEGYVK